MKTPHTELAQEVRLLFLTIVQKNPKHFEISANLIFVNNIPFLCISFLNKFQGRFFFEGKKERNDEIKALNSHFEK